MTDRELAEFLGILDMPNWLPFIKRMSPGRRAVYESMREVEKLLTGAVGPKRPNAIICRDRK